MSKRPGIPPAPPLPELGGTHEDPALAHLIKDGRTAYCGTETDFKIPLSKGIADCRPCHACGDEAKDMICTGVEAASQGLKIISDHEADALGQAISLGIATKV